MTSEVESSKIQVTDSAIEESNELKMKGNKLFADNCLLEACKLFTKAIELNKNNELLYCNRSLCHMRMENYGDALADAEKCITINPSFLKGYYRKGSALMAIGKFQEAASFYKAIYEKKPKMLEIKKKYDECCKIYRSALFAAAFENDPQKSAFDDVDLSVLLINDKYTGPRIPEDGQLTVEFVKELSLYQKDRNLLDTKYVIMILKAAKEVLEKNQNVVQCQFKPAEDKFTVCGDVHGQYYDLLHIFEINGEPSEKNQYLFNGDFVDRGAFSVEVIILLLAYKILYPNHFFLNRGNHETISMNQIYGFESEVKQKYSPQIFSMFTEVFDCLPLAHVLNNRVFVVHGGLLSEDGVTIADINSVNRKRQPPNSGLMCDLLWSDPQGENGRGNSRRGISMCFGPDVTKSFCETNSFDYVIRSHEMKENGYDEDHNGQCVTIFSAPAYADQNKNLGAFINFDADMKPKYTTFKEVLHPNVSPSSYMRNC